MMAVENKLIHVEVLTDDLGCKTQTRQRLVLKTSNILGRSLLVISRGKRKKIVHKLKVCVIRMRL